MVKNKVTTESVSEKLLRRRKVVPFYHELDDSLCSSLTEYTHNTEGSQCFDEPSDMDSVDSDDTPTVRPSKRRKIVESDDEIENNNDNSTNKNDSPPPVEKEEEQNFNEMFLDEEDYRYVYFMY